ncbi:non-hydrolyzing UDP-N-acetylglucosamine 2-epimerase [Rugamonas aquatica]|uniref:UDP-N-acetylglucosamine 2-epimerase (Non-hydrolyzing) n=1 Tax=Rugamonas aquatica TaxID=2743357 RepID=A0A6A7MWK3_9BURK|nr:UDP-N-acetylglucosamine 2-epimerase (non-hydrolyzing) [Rugamonas aquatica]MQA36978.1 UDP-N-acetylglucosamine 2-epimerase (non-hydrolyzing) [Rugamonas aquatica]
MSRIVCVAAARSSLMKMAPVLRALTRALPDLETVLVHCDDYMDGQFFTSLEMRLPDFHLQVDRGNHALQTAQAMQGFEPVLEQTAPAAVLVVGDDTSSLACALTAAKQQTPLFHLDAGLRSHDRAMPEEINRLLIDQLSTLLFTSEASATSNLLREGISQARIHFVGNVMVDTLQHELPHAPSPKDVLRQAHLAGFVDHSGSYALLTLHRPSNIDDPRRLRTLIETTVKLSDEVPILFPLHPRTRAMLQQHELGALLDTPRVACLPPQSYRNMLGLMKHARVVLTDSDGVQAETTALAIPCLTLRENTERPVTVTEGSNAIAGRDPSVILALSRDILRYGGKAGRMPPLWDGHAAERIADHIGLWLAGQDDR